MKEHNIFKVKIIPVDKVVEVIHKDGAKARKEIARIHSVDYKDTEIV